MLYKKYVIEVVYETKMIEHINMQSNNNYENQIQMNLIPMEKTVNIIMFLTELGIIRDFVYCFDTYKEAFNTLSTHYYSAIGDINVVTLKIVSVYNDLIPPVEVLRAMKLKSILK